VDIFREMSLTTSEPEPLDLSFKPLDLSVKRGISISDQINGVDHFPLDKDKVAADNANATSKNKEIDVEAWDDSLWRVKTILKVAEILEDWQTEYSEVTSNPWRCEIEVNEKDSEEEMGYTICESGTIEKDLNSISDGVADDSELFMFLDPPVDECRSDIGRSIFNKPIELVASEQSQDFTRSTKVESSTLNEHITDLSSSAIQEKFSDFSSSIIEGHNIEVPLVVQDQAHTSPKRKLENFNSNNDKSESVPIVKRWRCDLPEGESVDIIEELTQVSDSEEGSDVVVLPVSDETSCMILEDDRSILCDSDLQMFPPSDLSKDSSDNKSDSNKDSFVNHSSSVTDVTEVLMEVGLETSVVNTWGNTTGPDGADESMEMKIDDTLEFNQALNDKEVDDRSTPRDVLEIIPDLDFMDGLEILTEGVAELEAKSKVEPNNNVDDFLSDLLINLP